MLLCFANIGNGSTFFSTCGHVRAVTRGTSLQLWFNYTWLLIFFLFRAGSGPRGWGGDRARLQGDVINIVHMATLQGTITVADRSCRTLRRQSSIAGKSVQQEGHFDRDKFYSPTRWGQSIIIVEKECCNSYCELCRWTFAYICQVVFHSCDPYKSILRSGRSPNSNKLTTA
jgi:hypothetical protein